MLSKLVEQLANEDGNWRQHVLVQMDNVPHHRTRKVTEFIQVMQLPVMYVSPHSPMLQPIEKVFGFLKRG